MKLCTKAAVRASHVEGDATVVDDAEFIDISLVDDGHEFGLAPDGTLHIEGDVHSAPAWQMISAPK